MRNLGLLAALLSYNEDSSTAVAGNYDLPLITKEGVRLDKTKPVMVGRLGASIGKHE